MLSLYFNTKLVGSGLHAAAVKYGDSCVRSSIYHRKDNGLSQIDVLIGVIESYNNISFRYAVFNIDVSDLVDSVSIERVLSDKIYENIGASRKLIVNFRRPSTVKEWSADVEKYASIIGTEYPVLVVMNHDHPFVDYNSSVLESVVEDVFNVADTTFGKVLPYSHVPEVISGVLNKKMYKDVSSLHVDGVYLNRNKVDWIDSIYVMSMGTLLYIFNSLCVLGGGYVGRFDWSGVYYRKKLDLKFYAYFREFFRHYDGYSHVTGMRIDSELVHTPFVYEFPHGRSVSEVVGFYYQRWIDCYFIFLRDFIGNCSIFSRRRTCFDRAIDISIEGFCVAYIDQDVRYGFIDKSDKSEIISGLLDKIHYNFNCLYHEIDLDVRLMKGGG